MSDNDVPGQQTLCSLESMSNTFISTVQHSTIWLYCPHGEICLVAVNRKSHNHLKDYLTCHKYYKTCTHTCTHLRACMHTCTHTHTHTQKLGIKVCKVHLNINSTHAHTYACTYSFTYSSKYILYSCRCSSILTWLDPQGQHVCK